MRADQSAEAESFLTLPDEIVTEVSWSRVGERFLFRMRSMTSNTGDIWWSTVGGTPQPFVTTEFNERTGSFSPDGQWVAYVSDESGEDRVFLKPVPEGRVVPVSTGPGTEPLWSRNGRELYYRDGSSMLFVPVDTESEIVGTPEILFADTYEMAPLGQPNYDVSSDGRFLMVRRSGGPELRLVLNWFEEFEARVPR